MRGEEKAQALELGAGTTVLGLIPSQGWEMAGQRWTKGGREGTERLGQCSQHLPGLGGQVVKAGLDVLVVVVTLFLIEGGFCI